MCALPTTSDVFPQTYALAMVGNGKRLMQSGIGTSLRSLPNFFAAGGVDEPAWFWLAFGRPIHNPQRKQHFHRKGTSARFEVLPNELLNLIIDHLSDNKEDILAFGLCSGIFWPVVLHRIHQGYTKCTTSWAGAKVAFHGLHSTSLALHFQEDEIRRDPHKIMANSPHFLDRQSSSSLGNHFTRLTAGEFLEIKPFQEEWMDALRKREQWRGFSPRDWLAIEQDLSCSYLYPRRCVWLLRNLTTLEYVRSDQLSPTTDAAPKNSRGLLNLITSSRLWGLLSFKDPPSRHSSSAALPVTLAQIMLLLTCFSTNVSFKERVLGFQWGVWAGHQIDVVTLEAHMDERGNKSWKNVSEAVVRDVTNLRLWSKRWMKSKHENSNLSINWEVLYNDRKAHHYWATR